MRKYRKKQQYEHDVGQTDVIDSVGIDYKKFTSLRKVRTHRIIDHGRNQMAVERLEDHCVSQADIIDSMGRTRKTNIIKEG